MSENKRLLISNLVDFIGEYSLKDIPGDPLNNPEDLEVFLSQPLLGGFDLDSLDFVELLLALEDEFDTELPDELFEDINEDTFSVRQFIGIVTEHLNKIRIA